MWKYLEDIRRSSFELTIAEKVHALSITGVDQFIFDISELNEEVTKVKTEAIDPFVDKWRNCGDAQKNLEYAITRSYEIQGSRRPGLSSIPIRGKNGERIRAPMSMTPSSGSNSGMIMSRKLKRS